MSKFQRYVARQLSKPEGIGGRVITFIMNRSNGAMYSAVCDNIPKGGRMLEIGFGNGYCMKKVAASTDASICGVDISADMVAAASKRNKKNIASGKISLMLGSVEEIPFDREFDLIYTTNTVYFWPDLDAGYRSIADKLTDGGVFMNGFYTKERLERKAGFTRYGFAKYSPDELISAAERCGLATESKDIGNGACFIKATKR